MGYSADEVHVATHQDAALVGYVETHMTTYGSILFVHGPNARFAISFISTIQPCVPQSTHEPDMFAMHTTDSSIVLTYIVLMGRPIPSNKASR